MIRMAQYGTKHGHASGKLRSMQENAEVEVVGVYEPDRARRREVEGREGAYTGVRWFESEEEMLGDETIIAIASEGLNAESLAQTEAIVGAGKHVWYDKPAGDDWRKWQEVVALAREKSIIIQMGYMLRYHDGFERITGWAREGVLGEIFCVRAHMSTNITEAQRKVIGQHRGGILYDLGGHMLDPILWMLGRPEKVTAFLRNDGGAVPEFSDNTLGVLEFESAMAWVDIAAMEPRPMARRFEVYGRRGSAILLEPFEPGHSIRLCLEEAAGDFAQGEHTVEIESRSRQKLYDLELVSFLQAVRGEKQPDRTLDHELLVQETLLRATGGIAD